MCSFLGLYPNILFIDFTSYTVCSISLDLLSVIQHQTMSRRLQLDQLRAELSNVQSQIHVSHNQPPGTYNLQELVFQKANLMQRLT